MYYHHFTSDLVVTSKFDAFSIGERKGIYQNQMLHYLFAAATFGPARGEMRPYSWPAVADADDFRAVPASHVRFDLDGGFLAHRLGRCREISGELLLLFDS